MMLKRLAGLVLSALLLAGCGDLALTPSAPAPDTTPVPQEEAPRGLAVYDPENRMAAVLELYQNSQGVPVTKVDSIEKAHLAAFPEKPDGTAAKDIAQSSGLVHNIAAESPCYGFSMGGTNYGYVVNPDLIKNLLGSDLTLSEMSSDDWNGFVTVLDEWIDDPAGQQFTVGSKTYSLPEKKEGPAANLKAVFAVESETRYSGPLLSPVLATCYPTGEAFVLSDEKANLTGGLNSLFTLLGQEICSLSKLEAPEAFAAGEAVFCRTTLAAAERAGGKNAQVLPLPFSFDYTDLHGGLPLEELLGKTVELPGSWLGIPLTADEHGTKEAESFLLWRYASEEGRKLPKDNSEAQAGIPNLAASISDEGAAALKQLGEEQTTWDRDGRGNYTKAALALLEKEGVSGNA